MSEMHSTAAITKSSDIPQCQSTSAPASASESEENRRQVILILSFRDGEAAEESAVVCGVGAASKQQIPRFASE
jgi:hypothetical protein